MHIPSLCVFALISMIWVVDAFAMGTEQQKLAFAEQALGTVLKEKGAGYAFDKGSLSFTECTGVVNSIGNFLDMLNGGAYECKIARFSLTDASGKKFSGSLQIDTETLYRTRGHLVKQESDLPGLDQGVVKMSGSGPGEEFYIGYHYMTSRDFTPLGLDVLLELHPAPESKVSDSAAPKPGNSHPDGVKPVVENKQVQKID